MRMNASWVQLEYEIDNSEVARELKRELHTLKGEASLLGFTVVSQLAHALEDILKPLVEAGQTPDMDVGDHIMNAFDALVSLAEREPDEPSPDGLQLISQLRLLMSESGQPVPPPVTPPRPLAELPDEDEEYDEIEQPARPLPPKAPPSIVPELPPASVRPSIPLLRFCAGPMRLGIAAEDVLAVTPDTTDEDLHIASILDVEPASGERRTIRLPNANPGPGEPSVYSFQADMPLDVIECATEHILPMPPGVSAHAWHPVIGFADISETVVILLDIPSVVAALGKLYRRRQT